LAASSGFDQPLMIALVSSRILELVPVQPIQPSRRILR
jgi:hypothetical protein